MTAPAWHFLGPQRQLRYAPYTPVVLGETLRCDHPPVICETGLHASRRVVDALDYAPQVSGLVLCRVTLGGAVVEADDKLVATERTVTHWADADPMLHELACWYAELAILASKQPADPRSLAAIATKRAWLQGKATDADLAAAWAAARAAAMDAAWDAAGAAARDAARAAAGDAAWAAAWAAARAAAADEIERRSFALVGINA